MPAAESSPMADLRFAGAPPRKRKPRKALFAAGLIALLAAAFGVGRLWTRPPAPETVPATAPTAVPSEPATPVPAVARTAPPGAAPTVAFVPAEPRLRTNSEVFEIARTPAPAAAERPAAEPSAAPVSPGAPEPLGKQIARCLSFTVSRDSMFTVTSGVRLLIKAR